MTGAHGGKPDPEVDWLQDAHRDWAIDRIDGGAIRAMREFMGNQQITSSYDAAELDERLKGYGPGRIIRPPRGQASSQPS